MNRLASAASSYLRSAAHQPVDWHAWGAEAFDRARREDKPVLLDIGAVWCHWCHVMDHESYEDAATAELVNRLFVPVKVDRDERPDVDARYQKAVQAITGQGGWPLTAFLLPDGRVFYGGTYFPPVDAHGRPSFRRVLEAVAHAYRAEREQVLGNAKALDEHLALRTSPRGEVGEASWQELLDAGMRDVRAAFDAEHGGFGGAPKFPHPATHDLLVARAVRGDATARDVVLATLERMGAGGIYDHLAGGFHRYSVDAEWHVPHFEKMLYDNAGLLRNYARAGALLGRPDLLATATQTAGFLRDVLGQPGGGFGGSQDADVGPADDGDHFTWSLAELQEAVGDVELARLAAMHYDVRSEGDMHHRRDKCVLRVVAEPEALASALGRSEADVRAALDEAKARMAAARAKRPAPFVDPLRYASWNGMAIGALLELGGRTGSTWLDEMAIRALDAFLADAFDPGTGFARGIDLSTRGLLDDNAQMLDALLEAHLATGEARYLEAARSVGALLERFAHPHGGFADRAEGLAPAAEAAPLGSPERPTQDAPTASPNGVACRALLRLAAATGEPRFEAMAREALRALAPEAARLGVFGGALLLALDEATHPPPRVVVSARDVAAYRAVVRREAMPGATLASRDDPGVPDEARAFPGEGAIVCVGTRCLAPARTPADLAERLAEARR